MPTDPSINGRPLQWRDLSNRGRKIVSDNVREAGQNIPDLAMQHAKGLARSTKATPGNVATAEGAAAQMKPRNVSLQSAANRREELYNRAVDDRAAANPHDPHQVIPTGAGWYFEHHKEIAQSASTHGFDRDRAIAASGVMSPQNSPENERASVNAIMDAKANHSVHITPEVAEHLGKNGIDVSQHVGKRVPFKNLPTGTVTHLSDRRIRGKVDTGADLINAARGGTRQNMVKAEQVLDGSVHPDEAVNPHSAPKVWSYVHNTRQAVPGSPTHVEYMGRVHQDALVRRGQIDKDQQALDLYGHAKHGVPDDNLLSPHSHTVEDTWQNAATFDQPKTTVPGTKTSVFKAGGSLSNTYPVQGIKTRVNEETGKKESAHADARVSPAGLTHAFNNRATQKAAEQLGHQSGTTVPPVAVQEVGWVQMRKDAGKDAAHNAEQRSKPREVDPHEGQGVLPGFEGVINDRRKR